MIVPRDLRKFVGKVELRYTLNTGYVGLAKSRARLLAGQVQEFFRRLREIVKLDELKDEQIHEIVNRYFRNFVDGLEKIRVEPEAFNNRRETK
jgi:ATP-dependent Clp protease ATP-binding subunit ClpA